MESEFTGLDLTFPVEYLKAAVVLSLLTVWVLVGLFSYLNLYTRRRYFTLWTCAWLFYALWLTLCIRSSGRAHDTPLFLMLKQWCVSASAVCLLWGSSVFHNLKPRQTMFGLFIVFLFVWSYTGAYHLEDPLHIQLPIFAIIGLSSGMTAWAFFKFRLRRGYIGAGLLAGGFFFWGVYLAGYPFIQMSEHMVSSGFLVSAVLQLFIAVSMIILVLEEVRSSNKLAFQQLRSQKNEKAVLQQKVASTEERYRELFDQAHEGIIIVAADDLQILEMNQTARKLLGMQNSVLKNPSLRQFVSAAPTQEAPPAGGPEWFEWVRRVHQVTVVRFDGGATQVEIVGAGVDFDGRAAFQFFLREVTERARLEQQLRQAERLSALGQMISGVAHELNNPLAVIMGYIELVLQRQGLTDQTRGDLQKVALESQRAANLVGNFLSFARGRAARRTGVDLNKLIRRVIDLRQPETRVTGVEVTTRLDPEVPRMMADPDQLQQVLVNLVGNSLQAMLDRPLPGRIHITTAREGGNVRIRVEDSGPGIPPETQVKIFEPFFTTKDVGVGTGLGLSIAHSIVAEHNGRIHYEPAKELGGACFVIELPLVEVGAELKKETGGDTRFDFKLKPLEKDKLSARVLVLDDEESIASLLGEMLTLLGHRVTVCHSGSDALAELERSGFDVVLSDFRMPGMDGKKFFHLATAKRAGLSQRIIFLTGDTVNEETQAFLQSVGAPCVGKPFHLEKIEQAVASVLHGQGQAAMN